MMGKPGGSQTRWRDLARLLPALLLALALGLSAAGEGLAQGATPAARRELAPTGTLRFGVLPTTQSFAVGTDLGQELARRLGVPFVPVAYPNAAAAVDGARSGQVDAVVLGIDPVRAAEFDAAPYLAVDMTYLVPAASPIRTVADADRQGVRIAAPPGSIYQLTLERQLRAAELVGLVRPDAFPAMEAGTIHALAFERPTLVTDAAERPSFRVVDGRFGVTEHAVLLLKGRPAALAFVTEVAEQAKVSGLVQRWVAQAGLQGVQVPAPARGLRLPATGAAPAPSGPQAAAAATLLLLGAWLAVARRRHRWPERV